MTLLRIRDPKSTENLDKLKKLKVKPRKSTHRRITTKAKTSQADTKSSSVRLEDKTEISRAGDKPKENSNHNACYVSSFTHNSDVTFTTTLGVRSSVTFEPNREITVCEIDDLCPLDLSQNSANKQNNASAFDVNTSEKVPFFQHSFHHCSSTRSKRRGSTPFIPESSTEDRGSVSSNCDTFVSVAVEESDVFAEDDALSAMLSSRRHTSEENYNDRKHFALIDGKSTYSNAADAWMNTRTSPENDNMNGFAETKENATEQFESNSESSYRSEHQDFDKTIDERDEYQQEDAFNYSTKNRASDEENSDITSCSEVNVLKAKKARVENIVTSIKDKPNKPFPSELNNSDTNINIRSKNSTLIKQNSRKRKMNEKIQELQKEIAFIQQQCEIENNSPEMSSSDESSPEELKNWNHQNKRPKIINEISNSRDQERDRLPDNYNGFYRGSLNVTVPQNGRRSGVSDCFTPAVAYDVLVQSLKRELTSALERVAEESARRVLEEFHTSSAIAEKNLMTQDSEKVNKDDKQRCTTNPDEQEDESDVATSDKLRNDASNLINGDNDRSQTSNQSQLCFGNVQERRRRQGSKDKGSVSVPRAYWSQDRRYDEDLGASCPERAGTYTDDNEVQTHALSLVKKNKRLSSSSRKSSPLPGEHFPFVQISKEGFSSNLHDLSQKQMLESQRSPTSSVAVDAVSGANMSPPTSLYGKQLLPQSLYAENNLHTSASSAFRFPIRHDPLGSPSFRGDLFVPASMKTSPIFRPSVYSSATPPQSLFPFTSGQLSFPIFQNFHQQRSLASAIADYGGLRERFHPNRPTSTRTSTREPSRSAGLPRGQQQGPKTDSLDFRSASDVSPYSAASIQEGLTPQHLKKAKLMFFYTRYPSANTLKTYFSDVKFSRATTSQLIKWFSNFREFYYIQMEKFARQALGEGVTDINQLYVTRDSDLYRVLNLHYNKSNDFKVPNEFLNATSKSLQEFFSAIQSNSDRDPSWKKVIYKVICKLDQDIPELFKSATVLDRLDEIVN